MTSDSNRDDDESIRETEAQSDMPGVSLSLDAVFEVLAHHHRRDLLRFLSDAPDHTATVDEVTAHLIKREAQRRGEQPGRDQIEMAIHHIHLPKLTEVGVVEYDARSTELRYWRHDWVEDLLEYIQSYDAD